jgi:hypothetical protein
MKPHYVFTFDMPTGIEAPEKIWSADYGQFLIRVGEENKTQLELRQMLRQVIEDNRHLKERLELSANTSKLLKEGLDIAQRENALLQSKIHELCEDLRNKKDGAPLDEGH